MDIYFFDVDWLPLTTVLAAFSIFPVQLLLCFKVKSRVLRFLPLILLTVAEAVFIVLSCTAKGWDALGYLFFVLLTAMMMLLCGIAWGVWAFMRNRRQP